MLSGCQAALEPKTSVDRLLPGARDAGNGTWLMLYKKSPPTGGVRKRGPLPVHSHIPHPVRPARVARWF